MKTPPALQSLASRPDGPAPLVTFGIPAYNRPAMLAETLTSIAEQTTFSDYEVVVCDDGGLPETRDVVASFPREKFSLHVNTPPLGAVSNWNRCIERARGHWVTILHEDDVLYPWFLELTVPRLRAGLSALCTRTVQGETQPPLDRPPLQAKVRSYPPAYYMKSGITPFPGVLFPRELGCRLGGFDEAWGPLADYEYWYRLSCAGPVEVVQAIGAFYRVNPGQWTDRAWPRMLREMHLLRLRIAREQFARTPRQARWLARFFTYRAAVSYQKRFPERPAVLSRALQFRRIPLSGLPSGWVWSWLRLSSR